MSIKKRDIVKISTGGYGIIIDIQYEFNRYQLLGVSNWQLGIENIEKMYTETLVTALNEREQENVRLRNYLETLRSNTPYGLYQQQITEVLQDAQEYPCTCGNCDGEHFGMAIRDGVNL